MRGRFSTGIGPGSIKVGLSVEWKRYEGYSYLFDNPGNSLRLDEHCRLWNDNKVPLYNALWECVCEFGGDSLISKYHFFPLPKETYHVTVWDGIHVENIENIIDPAREELTEFLAKLPESVSGVWPQATPISELYDDGHWTIEFCLRHKPLYIRGDTVLVADLEATGEQSQEVFRKIHDERIRLDKLFLNRYGKPENAGYVPHVALGYFTDPKRADEVWRNIRDGWNDILESKTRSLTIQFNSIGLYAFSDMLSYFRKSPPK